MKAPAPPEQENVDVAPLAHELAEVTDALERLAVELSLGHISQAEHQGARRRLLERRGRVEKQLARQTRRLRDDALYGLLSELWDDLGKLAEKPAILAAMPVESRRDLFETADREGGREAQRL